MEMIDNPFFDLTGPDTLQAIGDGLSFMETVAATFSDDSYLALDKRDLITNVSDFSRSQGGD